MQSFSVRLPDELVASMQGLMQEGMSQTEIVRRALREYLRREKFLRLRDRLLPYSEAQRVYTDEDVFREVS